MGGMQIVKKRSQMGFVLVEKEGTQGGSLEMVEKREERVEQRVS